MTTKVFTGRIRLKSGGFPIKVSINATSNSAGKKAIEAQFGNNLKSWDKNLSSNN
jgi:hypothetical protein